MDQESLDILRHSASHVLAHAVRDLFPNAKLGIGPAIKDGFYYDFDLDVSLTDADLEKIEKRMKEIIKAGYFFEQSEMPKKEALAFFKDRGEIYKCELIEALEDDKVSIYKSGDFIDLCKGPHIESTKQIKAFKLLHVAGAYWRGDEKNKMLSRIYATAFETKDELKQHLFMLEEAKKRDHRLLGKQLDLFSLHEEAPGVPFFHPKGLAIYNKLIEFWRKEHVKEGYVEVKTPLIMRDTLWRRSGHFDHYQDNMYFTEIDGGSFAVKPMNCPGGLLIYRNSQHSYREFPIKMAELGQVHRHERSGVLHGLFRVNSFIIDDAHIFCLEDQIADEVYKAIKLILRIYKTFGFDNVSMELSTRPEKAMGSDEMWEKATNSLQQALEDNKIDFKINEGDGAFYGPKIDFHIKDSIGRSWQCGTIQLDFSMPERFELEYVGQDGAMHRPVMIHRAAFGSIERFFGILIEHYAGAFPLWLAPVQVKVMAISEKFGDYARQVKEKLVDNGIKAELDLRNEKIGYKIREAEKLKVNYMIIIGEQEVNTNNISVRAHGREDLGTMDIEFFIGKLNQELAVI